MNPSAPSPSDSSIAQQCGPICTWCEGRGYVGTGIDESPTTICGRCDGIGYEPGRQVQAASGDTPEAAVGGDVVATFSGRRLSPEGTREFYGYLADGVDMLPEDAPLYTTPQDLKLDRPATIRSTTFGVGVKWSTVIERAQREHEYQKQEKKERKTPAAPVGGFVVDALTFDAFRAANVARCIKWHPEGIASWSPSDWLTAVTGELGELASLLKMRNRERDGLAGNKFSPTDKMVADEIADVLTYLDLLAAVLNVDMGRAAVSKFNEVSERVGFPDRISLSAADPVKCDAWSCNGGTVCGPYDNAMICGNCNGTGFKQEAPTAQPSAKDGVRGEPVLPWRDISELEPSDDPHWFLRKDGRDWVVDGPRATQNHSEDQEDGWQWFCECESPPISATTASGLVDGLLKQSRRVRNFSNPDEVFEAVPVTAIMAEAAIGREVGP